MSIPSSRTRLAIALEALAAELLEVLAGGDDALAHRRSCRRAAREQRHLEGAAIVAFEHLRHQLAGGVDWWKSAER